MQDNRNDVLTRLALILIEESENILNANQKDLSDVCHEDLALVDRLKLDTSKVKNMAQSLVDTAIIPDPDGKILYNYIREDGLNIQNVSVPFGTILIIYESRPDVTIEAAAMAFKSGNRILLKGGKEAHNTNKFLVHLWHQALAEYGWPIDWVTYLDLDRAETQQLISNPKSKIDLIIPRGGDTLIDFVRQNSSAPVIISGRGNNFVYIHEDADTQMAMDIIINGKSRLSVCNATDKVLIHKNLFNHEFLTPLAARLEKMNIDILGDEKLGKVLADIREISGDEVLYEEFLSAKIYMTRVNNLKDAINIINTYSGGHSASIITQNEIDAHFFMANVDCAAVYHNASTRFTDGGQVGFGGEMAISTQKLHFRGPVGMGQLVTNKWFIKGNGHIRI